MKPGTHGFLGARLRVAREANGLSAADLAVSIDVTPAAVSQYEHDRQSPSPDVMRRICEELDLPLQHFRRPLNNRQRLLFFRSLTTATKSARRKCHHRYEWLKDCVSVLWEFIDPPSVNFPDFGTDPPGRELSPPQIESLASELRRFWNLSDGPISNLVWLLENNGAVVARQSLGSEKLDAYSEWCDSQNRPFIILGTDKASAVRSRFDAAHELAHMVLHRNVEPGQFENKEAFKRLESQANRLATAFLLPREAFRRDLYSLSLDGLRCVKEKWMVSIAAMIMRASQIGEISKEKEKRLFINLTRRGWKHREPLDDDLLPEEPQFTSRCFQLILDNGLLRGSEFPDKFGLNPTHVENLFGLRQGTLNTDLSNRIQPVTPKMAGNQCGPNTIANG